MNLYIMFYLFFSSILYAHEHLSLSIVENKLLSLRIRQTKFSNLSTGKSEFLKKSDRHIILWSIDCNPCLQEIKNINKLSDKSFALINIDPGIKDQKKADIFLKKHAIKYTSLNDNNFFSRYIGDEIPTPTNILVNDQNILKVFFGYNDDFIKSNF